jgi:DNA-binding NarL/FixJ family response regulator
MPETDAWPAELSAREAAVLLALGRGDEPRAAATALDITLEELERSLQEIYDKLQISALRCALELPPQAPEEVAKEREPAAV